MSTGTYNAGVETKMNPHFKGAQRMAPLAVSQHQQIPDTVRSLLGNTTTIVPTTSVNLDLKSGHAHSHTGIPYAIGGSATIISQQVGAWLSGYQDPIKAILGVGVHKTERIIIKRKYVVGGSATITPERAPARTCAIKEDVREITLVRYGGDIEMNLNLMLIPEDAREELQMKVDAQKRELERMLTNIGYEILLSEGTPIVNAILRSNPTPLKATAWAKTAHRIYSQQIFGAMNKSPYPIASLLAGCRYASAYSLTGLQGAALIIPHGIPDLLRYTRKEAMTYSVSGVKPGNVGGKGGITMALENAYTDDSSGVKILIHHVNPTYQGGHANPQISSKNPGGLTDETYVFSRFVLKAGEQIADLEEGGFDTSMKGLDGNEFTAPGTAFYRRVRVVASSAILGVPGAGELLIGYVRCPFL
jgi:hypothetical protein